ncbi:hypothetical protein [Parashewanella spongiae]|uniref:hypothetical protein n=1 Tax=Parashewanella spongiae TaxID=342950 RepID=UPI0015D34DA9|nr:hypothetical protein [Parashewanella spongiae]
MRLSKRSGIEATEVVYLLMFWVWLKVDTISMFAKESLLSFSSAKGRGGRMYTNFIVTPANAGVQSLWLIWAQVAGYLRSQV